MTIDPAQLINSARYPIADADSAAAKRVVADARREIASSGLVLLPGFLTGGAIARMVAEAVAAQPRSHRRDIAFGVYRKGMANVPPEGHPARRTSPFRQWVIATDLLPADGALRRLFAWEPLTRFVGELIGEKLYCTADPLACCNVTIMRDGDEHGWHFDDNDFVVSLLLQEPEEGGLFEVRPGARSEHGIDHEAVAATIAGTDSQVVRKHLTAGILSLFRGERALHRVSPVKGEKHRMIALFSYDRRPGMVFPEATRIGAFGRAS